MRPPIPAWVFLAAVLASPAAAQMEVAPVGWGAYTQGLLAPASPVASALGLDFHSPLVAGSFSAVMALQPTLTPAALAAQPAPQQVAAIQGAIRAAAAPLAAAPAPGVAAPAAALPPDALVHLQALAPALPSAERDAVVSRVKSEMDRRGQSLADAVVRVSANFESRRAEDDLVAGNAQTGVRSSGLRRFEPSSSATLKPRPAVDASSSRARTVEDGLVFPDYASAHAWLKKAPMGLLDQVVVLPSHSNEISETVSRATLLAKLGRAASKWTSDTPPLPVMISRAPGTRRVLGIDFPVNNYYFLVSEVSDSAPASGPGDVGLHKTSLRTALDVIKSGVFLSAPGRVTFYGSAGDEVDAGEASHEPGLRFHLGDGSFRRADYFGSEAYAPAFKEPAPGASRDVPPSVSADGHNRYLADFIQAGMVRRIPFTPEDAESTLALLEAQRRRGLADAVYLPMKAALEESLRAAGRAPAPKEAPAPAPLGDPFAAIVPKVSRAQLDAALAAAPGEKTARLKLGSGTEAYAGVFAVAERGAEGTRYYAEKHYDGPSVAEQGTAAMRLARGLESKGLLAGFDVAEILSAEPGSNTVRLSLAEGQVVSLFLHDRKSNPGHEAVAGRYEDALRATAAALNAAGWKATLSLEWGSLYVYGPPGAANQKLAFQFIPQNIIATPDGRFVLIDPF